MAKATRIKMNTALKEDIKHVLEELWDIGDEEPFYKIFSKQCIGTKSVIDIIRSDKETLKELSHEDDEGIVHYLEHYEMSKMGMLVHYRSHLIAI